jgi:hypothetical protein
VIDRGKIAVLLLMLGAGLAVVGSFQDVYQTVYRDLPPERTMTTTLWIVRSVPPDGPDRDAYYPFGLPVLIAAVLLVVAAVLALRERTGHVAKPVAAGAAGALAAFVFAYWLLVRREEESISDWPINDSQKPVLEVLGGMYLLVAAAVIGLAGATLVQWRQREQPEPLEEDEVVVHQLDSDDDTPPFGIAIPDEQQQEAR